MKLNQLRLYKNKQHYANIPVGMAKPPEPNQCVCLSLQTPTGVPWDVMRIMEDFVREETGATRLREWSWEWSWEWPWEWQEIPSIEKSSGKVAVLGIATGKICT